MSMKGHTLQVVGLPAAAATLLEVGHMCATNAAGLAVPATDAAGLTFQGFIHRGLDNTSGAAGWYDGRRGERTVDADQGGPWSVEVVGATPKPGEIAYVVNPTSCQAVPNVSGLMAGRFTEPSMQAGCWFVDPQGAF